MQISNNHVVMYRHMDRYGLGLFVYRPPLVTPRRKCDDLLRKWSLAHHWRWRWWYESDHQLAMRSRLTISNHHQHVPFIALNLQNDIFMAIKYLICFSLSICPQLLVSACLLAAACVCVSARKLPQSPLSQKYQNLNYFENDPDITLHEDMTDDNTPSFTGDNTKAKIVNQESYKGGQGKFKYS